MENKTTLKAINACIVLWGILLCSCQETKDNWSQAGQHSSSVSTRIMCGDSLEIKLSNRDSLFVHSPDAMNPGMCHIRMWFGHRVNGKLQHDSSPGDGDKWVIQYDSTIVKIKCLPATDSTECDFTWRAKGHS